MKFWNERINIVIFFQNNNGIRMSYKDIILPDNIKKEIEISQKLQFTQNSLVGNYNDLKKAYLNARLMEIIFSGGRVLFENNESLIECRHEMIRTMTNVIFSAKILIEHTRNTMKKYKSLGHNDIYEYNNNLVKSSFLEDPLSNFMETLRNYVTHVGPIPINVRSIPPQAPYLLPMYFYAFDEKKLMKWSGLKEKLHKNNEKVNDKEKNEERKREFSVKYLKNRRENLDILNEIEEYVKKVINHQNELIYFIGRKFSQNA